MQSNRNPEGVAGMRHFALGRDLRQVKVGAVPRFFFEKVPSCGGGQPPQLARLRRPGRGWRGSLTRLPASALMGYGGPARALPSTT